MNEHIKLYDTSAADCTFFKDNYHKTSYSEFSLFYLQNLFWNISSFTLKLAEESAKTTPEVTDELKKFLDSLLKKQRIMESSYFKRSKRTQSKQFDRRSEFRKSVSMLEQTTEISYLKEFESRTTLYDSLFDIVNSLPKINTSIFQNIKPDRKQLPVTDQHIVTRAIYQSLFEQDTVTIITNDFDIPRLLFATEEILQESYYSLQAPKLSKAMKSLPISVLMPKYEKIKQIAFEKKLQYKPCTYHQKKRIFQQDVHANFLHQYISNRQQ